MRRSILLVLLATLALTAADLSLPLKPKSVHFAVIGDSGTGEKGQYEVGRQMAKYREKFPYDIVVMLGDNIYGGQSPADFKAKFEDPYKTLLDGGVKFYAALGNHDNPNQRFYKLFNMGEKRYYSFKSGNVEFFALDSTYMDPQQLEWLEQRLKDSNSAWKICFFHHPIYSDGRYHGPDLDLRSQLEPIFLKSGVKVVLTGHEHLYERLKPQKGINYFILGNAGQLRPNGLRPSASMAKGIDTEQCFMLVEVAGDQFYFQTISRRGDTVDSGVIQ